MERMKSFYMPFTQAQVDSLASRSIEEDVVFLANGMVYALDYDPSTGNASKRNATKAEVEYAKMFFQGEIKEDETTPDQEEVAEEPTESESTGQQEFATEQPSEPHRSNGDEYTALIAEYVARLEAVEAKTELIYEAVTTPKALLQL